jgi:hypothetical protein
MLGLRSDVNPLPDGALVACATAVERTSVPRACAHGFAELLDAA